MAGLGENLQMPKEKEGINRDKSPKRILYSNVMDDS